MSAPTESGSYERITGLSAVKQLTVPKDAVSALVQVSGQPVRIRMDGTDPTAANGYPLAVGSQTRFFIGEMQALKVIETAVSATLDVLYSRS